MTPEDEEFERIAREIRRNAAEDDDIQEYKKPWVGLTDKEIKDLLSISGNEEDFAYAIERKLKEKNF
jgi:hypothetical protein